MWGHSSYRGLGPAYKGRRLRVPAPRLCLICAWKHTQYFLFLGSLANSIKGLAFMANGSTRSVFNLSFARDNNIADITAK